MKQEYLFYPQNWEIKQNPTYISLFSGAGIGCYGFKLENFNCISTVEILEKRHKELRICAVLIDNL